MANIPGTNVPAVTFGPSGFVSPEASAILAGVQTDISAAFGQTLNFQLSTPQGQLATTIAAVIENTNGLFDYYTQQMDPAYAVGRMQDGIGRIYFLTRFPALPTTIQVACSGLTGVVIPEGATVVDQDQNIYACSEAGTIGAGGSVTLPFACTEPGPIVVPGQNAISIYQSITGWDSVTVSSGAQGRDAESRSEFEARRAASVAKNSSGQLPAVRGEVLAVNGVVSAYVMENDTNTDKVVGAVTLPANSLYVAASGGTDDDVASAIWRKKSPGCSYYDGPGTVTVEVADQNVKFTPPFPTYDVKFVRPSNLPILFAVDIVSSSLVPSNATALIQQAVLSAFSGGDDKPAQGIGSLVLASRFYAAISALGAWAQVRSIKLGSANSAASKFTGVIAATALTSSAVTSGAIAIGQHLLDHTGNLQPGTKITAGSGTAWTVTPSQTVASELMQGVLADQDSVQAEIDQMPIALAANVLVTVT